MTEPLRYVEAPARREAILELLSTTGHLRISEVAEHLGVSTMTARRDCEKLTDDGMAAKVRGGIRLASFDEGLAFEARASVEATAKVIVGQLAASLIQRDDVVGIDAGTTTLQVARHLPTDFTGMIVTHSIPVIGELTGHSNCRVLSLGGEIFRPSKALVGALALDSASQIDLTTLFLGAGAVNERGVFVAADVERAVKLGLMSHAARVVVVVDHLKFDSRAPVLLCSWEAVDVLVCDQRPPAKLAETLAQHDVDIVLPRG